MTSLFSRKVKRTLSICLATGMAVAMAAVSVPVFGLTASPLSGKKADRQTVTAAAQTSASYADGYIMPSVGQAEIDSRTMAFYNKWKKRYVRKDPYYKKSVTRFVLYNQQHQMYKDTHSPVAVTVSEAQGYGMIIMASMAGRDDMAKAYFDSMYRYYRRFRGSQNSGTYLMSWRQWDNGSKIYADGNDRSSASDGDIDIAYALLLADKQWGSSGTYDYKTAALNIIRDIYSYEVNKTTYTIQYGDWVKWSDHTSKNYTGTRSSDFMTAEFRAFAKADTQDSWDKVISGTYKAVASIRSRYSSATGLLPDFMYRKNGKFYPETAYSHESALDGGYGYNACRDPWRIGTDYLVSGSAAAKAETEALNKWIIKKTSGDPSKIVAGYKLSGIKAANYSDMCFTAPFLVSAVCGSGSSQKWVDALWKQVASADTTNYYNDTIKLICMITAGGRWVNA